MIGHKRVVVQLKKPSSVDENAVRECNVSGEPRRELFAPLVAFTQHNLLIVGPGTGLTPATERNLKLAVLMDDKRDDSEPPLGTSPGFAVEVDPRAQQGLMIVTRGAIDDYYCVDVTEHEAKQEIVVTLDRYKALAP